jgi:CubicO group peptidase (beta-lactamase class C family)
MKKVLMVLFMIGCIAKLDAQEETTTRKIDSFMSALSNRGQFSGAVLVTFRGKPLYKKGFGFANRDVKEIFTTATPCYIGSLSKQFTAMGIMILKERGKLAYDDPIRIYFPQLPVFMQPVTIRHLLIHSSGLALFNDYPNMTEQDVFNILLQQNSLHFPPGEKFEYCNANYTLLGMLIEKVSNSSLNDFLTKNVFIPIGMKNTYVDEAAVQNRKRAVGYYLFGDEYNYSTYIGGAASIISTVDDLYKWDRSLYNPTIVNRQSLRDAFRVNIKIGDDELFGKKGYGFGWFVCDTGGEMIVQHDGGFAGFRSYIERQPDKHNTIIFISNVRHSLTGEIRQAINSILENKPYTLPKISYANWIIAEAKKANMDKAIEKYKIITGSKDSSQFYFSESEFNSLGYYLLGNNKMPDAIKFFQLNTEKNPASSNAFDSLGEAYLKAGNKQLAIDNYKKSLALNPYNNNAAEMIKRLQTGE